MFPAVHLAPRGQQTCAAPRSLSDTSRCRARAGFFAKGREAHVRFLHELGRLAGGSGATETEPAADAGKDEL